MLKNVITNDIAAVNICLIKRAQSHSNRILANRILTNSAAAYLHKYQTLPPADCLFV